jgi:ribosome-associated toxin RatA of RatAB toxin-antitoxin module
VTHNTLSAPNESSRQGEQLSTELALAANLADTTQGPIQHSSAPHPASFDLAFDTDLKAASKTPLNTSQRALKNDSAYVEISTEKRPAKERRILATVTIPQPIEQVWQVITDYEHLADFVPNLTSSKLLSNPEGRIRLEQIGTQCFLKFKFCARVVLEMTENFPSELGFSMKEGDFKQFEGAWKLQPTDDTQSTQLSYELSVKPPRAMPAALIEHHICHNLTLNLLAIRQRVLELA